MIEELRKLNPHIDILPITNDSFKRYGRVLTSSAFLPAADYVREHTQIPELGNQYIADDERLKKAINDTSIFDDLFGYIPLQYGYVNGQNTKLNALEYHKTPEINIAVTPMVLLLSRVEDIVEGQIDSKKVEAYYLPENTAIVMKPMTLHFSPCKVSSKGFKCVVVLPKGTNTAIVKGKNKAIEDSPVLLMTNK